ncbi:MAG: peptide deformylase [Clostridiales bacterium]|nr:peptide deformylase [Clostridiales bacterium]
MAIREIVPHTDSFIRKRSKSVKVFDEKLWELLDDMHETLESKPGAGLSAVQVGVLKRVFIMNINEMKIEFVNPVITHTSGEQYKKEGCLSVSLPFDYVKRPFTVTVTAFDRYGNKFTLTCEDWTAVCVCHETDHLDGVLYIDKICVPPEGMAEDDE